MEISSEMIRTGFKDSRWVLQERQDSRNLQQKSGGIPGKLSIKKQRSRERKPLSSKLDLCIGLRCCTMVYFRQGATTAISSWLPRLRATEDSSAATLVEVKLRTSLQKLHIFSYFARPIGLMAGTELRARPQHSASESTLGMVFCLSHKLC